MLHELLAALSGFPGDLFTHSRDSGFLEVSGDLPFLHPSEACIINRVCRLASYYQYLNQFITRHVLPPASNTGGQHGLYICALAHGIDGVLEPYRQALVSIEDQCIADPQLSVSYLQHELEEYQMLFPSLDGTVKHVVRNKLHGGQLLSFLYKQCSCGVPSVRTAYERILFTCHGVFYKQLSAWLLHGLLRDNHKEFFIEPTTARLEALKATREDREEENRGETSDSGRAQFIINPVLAPSYIPVGVMEKILFIGEAVKVFISDDKMKLTRGHRPSGLEEAASQLKADQQSHTRLLYELQQQSLFDLRAFESCINKIRDSVAEHLWKLLVEECDLVGHLQIMKDFFLLARGDLYLMFVDIANPFMCQSPTKSIERDVNTAFQEAVIKTGKEDDMLLGHFRLTLPSSLLTDSENPVPAAATGPRPHPSAWNQLGLLYTPSWPLHILFTSPVVEKYNTLFKMLLAVRRAQMALQQTWCKLKMSRHRSLWQLKMHMSFLVDNLQYYVQVDVLETQFSLLLTKIKATHDYETIKLAHEHFLTTLQEQLFCLQPAVLRALSEVFELCSKLLSLVVKSDSSNFSSSDVALLDRISKEFSRQCSLLFRILSNIKTHRAAPHLSQLLLRLDYNKFFSTQQSITTTVSAV